jgi:type VI secretion system protein ImpM
MSDDNGGPPAANVPKETSAPGLYGKLSDRGDFVSRRLPRAFVAPWDAWLQDSLACSRARLGEAWLPAYLNAPVWRFVLSGGVCGENVMAGVMMPSVDKVGRHFPLTLAAMAPAAANPSAIFAGGCEWFGGLEDSALSTLDDSFAFETFDKALAACGPPPHTEDLALALGPPNPLEGGLWRFAVDPACGLGPGDPLVAHQILRASLRRYCLFWSAGSRLVAPSFLACAGLPTGDSAVALFDGEWGKWGWSGTKPGAMPWPEDEI